MKTTGNMLKNWLKSFKWCLNTTLCKFINSHTWKCLTYIRYNGANSTAKKNQLKYYCAQSATHHTQQHDVTKVTKSDVKQRDCGKMDIFNCNGWVFVTVFNDFSKAYIQFKHSEAHTRYCSIKVPDHIKQLVQDKKDLSPTQVCLCLISSFY